MRDFFVGAGCILAFAVVWFLAWPPLIWLAKKPMGWITSCLDAWMSYWLT